MTKETVQSLIRTLLIALGTYAVGHNFFGHVIDASIWEGIGGAVMAVAMVIWGMHDKDTTAESLESLVRSAGTAIGGVLVSLGYISGNALTEILGTGSVLAPAILSAIGRHKTQQVAAGNLQPLDTGKLVKAAPRVSILILILVGASMAGNAQSLFKPIPKPDTTVVILKGHLKKGLTPQANVYSRTLATSSTFQVTDTIPVGKDFSGLRLDGPTVMYLLPNNTVITTIGLSYEHDTWNASNGKFYTDWSAAAVIGAGGYFAPKDPTAVAVVGLKVSVFNKLLAIGVFYNLTTKQAQAGAGGGVALNN